MKTIWKYQLTTAGQIEMVKGAKVLSVGHQNDEIMIWAEADDNTTETEIRHFNVVGTGWGTDDHPGKFIDTVILDNGLVWHIYEKGKLEK